MAGDWFILVRATLADGRSLEEKVDVPGVASGRSAARNPSWLRARQPGRCGYNEHMNTDAGFR